MNAKEAKKILPKDEYEAFEPILLKQISRTPAAKLKQRATLSRKLRDKYRDLARRQAADVRTRRTNETDTSLHDRRARIFQEVIDYLEVEIDKPRRPARSAPGGNEKEAATQRREKNAKRAINEGLRRMRD